MNDDNRVDEGVANGSVVDSKTLDEIIRSAEFPDDYDVFNDELMDIIP